MKKSFILPLLLIVFSLSAIGRTTSTASAKQADGVYESISQKYAQGRISADSVISLALYHKVWDQALAEKCLKLVSANNPKAKMELGVLYAFSPEFTKHVSEGIRLLESSAKEGYRDASAYLGLYYFNHNNFKKAKAYFDAASPMNQGFGYTALGSMYLQGKGVPEDVAKARENFKQGALLGYPRGMTLYGFNMRAPAAGTVSYPDSFFWLYIAGDLGEDAARTTLFLPRQKKSGSSNSESSRQAEQALLWIEAAQTGKSLKNEPIYKDGFLPSLKARESAAEQGDDWARYYLGSMNYNGDFLNQNYAQALRYYIPIASNAKLPATLLAVVNERLAQMYREGKGTKADVAKADEYARAAARYGSLSAYKAVEKIR